MTGHPYDHRLRYRLYLNGKLAAEYWLDATNPDRETHADTIREHLKQATDRAFADGTPWLIETYDPAEPPAAAYTRFGTDTDGMVAPQPWRQP
jgi:hypothetical protein